MWILTHPHVDHIGAFIEIYRNNKDIIINDVYTANMTRLHSQNEFSDDASLYGEFLSLDLQQIGYLNKGDILEFYGLKIKILSAYADYVDIVSGEFPDNNIVNDGSLVFKVCGNQESMLFCADAESLSNYLIKEYEDELKSDYLQLSHHGNSGLSKEFYALINPKVAFMDASAFLMEDVTGKYDSFENAEFMNSIGSEVYTFKTAPNRIVLK